LAISPDIDNDSDDLEPSHDVEDCRFCGGSRFVRRMRDVDDPSFGQVEPCQCALFEADTTRRERLERLGNLSSLGHLTFDSLKKALNSENRLASLKIAQNFVEKPNNWLVITGNSGSGKTHMAAAIANGVIDSGNPALFMVCPDLLDHLRVGYNSEDADLSFAAIFEQVRDAPLLLLDDIDTVASTDWAQEKLFQLINSRYNERLPTVLTCASLGGSLDERLKTRLRAPDLCQILDLSGPPEAYHEIGGMTLNRLKEMGFGNFSLNSGTAKEQDSLRAAWQAAKVFAEQQEGWLVLTGTNGCGKTHIAAAVANEKIRNAGEVFFCVVPDLLDRLRSSYDAEGKPGGYDEIFNKVRNAPLLVLDDLGAQTTSEWALEKLYQIANYRTSSNLPTIITTDLSPDQLHDSYPRIFSRAVDPRAGTLISILAPNYRLGR
tara:strand:+ start:653 stop:1954 length:1302 start_codon:yes stop_codon:yes gene_type:complete